MCVCVCVCVYVCVCVCVCVYFYSYTNLLEYHLKIIFLNHQNNCVGTSNINNAVKILATSLSVLHNYFSPIKLFLNLYLAKF